MPQFQGYYINAFPLQKLYERLLISIREEVTRVLMRAQVHFQEPPPLELPDFITQHIDPLSGEDDSADMDLGTGSVLSSLGISSLNIPRPQLPADENGETMSPPLSRNSPCPCGSGKKFKHCHGQLA